MCDILVYRNRGTSLFCYHNMDPKEIGLSHAVSVSLTPVLSYHRNWLIVNSHIFLPQYFIQIAGTGVVNDNVDLTTAS